MGQQVLNSQSLYSYSDYLEWSDDDRCELITGKIYSMSPAPGTAHQELLVNLLTEIKNFIGKGPCKVFAAPFDVRLPEKNENEQSCSNVVQPDISVICDQNKIDDKGCLGAPDWIIEILSPSTSSKDQVTKKWLYERHGVKEYWLVHPIERIATIYHLKDNVFEFIGVYDDKAMLKSNLLKGFSLQFASILPETRIKVVKTPPAEDYQP